MPEFSPELDAKMKSLVESIIKLVNEKFPNDENARMSVLLVSYITMGNELGIPLEGLKEVIVTTMDLLQGIKVPNSLDKTILN